MSSNYISTYQKILEKQSFPTLNLTLGLLYFFVIPTVYQILTVDYRVRQIGSVGQYFALFQFVSSAFGMYGVEEKKRWALAIYKNTSIILSLVYLLIAIYLIVSLSENQYSSGVILLVTLNIILYILTSIWLLICYVFCMQYIKKDGWFDKQNHERINSARSSVVGGDTKIDIENDIKIESLQD